MSKYSSLRVCGLHLVRVVLLGGPVCFQSALAYSSNLVSLSFAGHLGQLQMSQAVLGLSAYNVTGFSLLLGMATGMETLCGQVRQSDFVECSCIVTVCWRSLMQICHNSLDSILIRLLYCFLLMGDLQPKVH